MTNRDSIIAKIKKCLALGKSSNEHEAAAAMRQAQKMMAEHGITDLDIQAAGAEEHRAKAGAKSHPAIWESVLAANIGDAFGCRVVFSGGGWTRNGEWCFVGCGAAPEVAHYAFVVLHRQAKRARDYHIKSALKRCKPATKTRRADLFSEGWVLSVVGTISAFAGSEQQAAAADAYLAKHYPALRNHHPRDRNDGRTLRDHEQNDYFAGRRSGCSAKINRGVGGQSAALSLE